MLALNSLSSFIGAKPLNSSSLVDKSFQLAVILMLLSEPLKASCGIISHQEKLPLHHKISQMEDEEHCTCHSVMKHTTAFARRPM